MSRYLHSDDALWEGYIPLGFNLLKRFALDCIDTECTDQADKARTQLEALPECAVMRSDLGNWRRPVTYL